MPAEPASAAQPAAARRRELLADDERERDQQRERDALRDEQDRERRALPALEAAEEVGEPPAQRRAEAERDGEHSAGP